MADFGGWEMPIEYPGSGVLREHEAVRTSVGIFDVSHLGKAAVTGPGAAAYVDACLTNALGRIGPGKAQYTLCCDDATGGVVDDLIVYLRSDDDVFLVPNAANTSEVARRLAAAAPPGVTVTDHHHDYGVLAVQGPRSADLLGLLGLPAGGEYMSFVDATWDGCPVLVCRSGYTGEHGYELLPSATDAPALWDALLEAGAAYGALACGLGARDTLRTEMGYPLHGHDLSLDITPVQAGAGWAVGWDKPAFWGRDARGRARRGTPPTGPGSAGDGSRDSARGHAGARPRRQRGGRGDERHVLPDAEAGHRVGVARRLGVRGGGGDRRRPRAARAHAGRATALCRRLTAMSDEVPPARLMLVGMMGAGKSTVGRALSAATGWPYLDNDAMLQAAAGASTRDVADATGPDALHGLEVRVLAAMLQHDAPFVAGAAASVVTSMIGRTLLKEHAYVVWLRARLDTLVARVGAGVGRPWLQPDPEGALRMLAEGRDPFYAEVADLVVDVDDLATDAVVDRILTALRR